MTTRTRSLLSLCSLLLVLAALIGMGMWLTGSRAAAAPPAGPAAAPVAQAQPAQPASVLPSATCNLAGSTRTCHLWAKTGTLPLPDGAVLPIWGFAETDVAAAQVPGPTIIANQGERLEVVLHNELLTETVSLAFPGQPDVLPDLDGVPNGISRTYAFTLTAPGTFLYEAGLTPHGTRQVAMGLAGALVIRPTGHPTWTYGYTATAFVDEALVVLNEFDPALNLDPYGFRIQNYAPRYWLINGRAYPQTLPIDTVAGNTVLLRYVNAGIDVHSMGLLGLHQQIIGADGTPKAYPYSVVADHIAAGQTLDTLVTIPPGAVTGTRYALYNTNLALHNAGQRLSTNGPLAFGGMLTFLETVTGTPAFDGGPLASMVTIIPNPTNGSVDVTLSAHLDDGAAGGQNVVAAEYFTNSLGLPGSGLAISVPAPAPGVDVSVVIPAATLANWPGGFPTFYVRGQDANGNWGPVGSVVLNLDKNGPDTTGLSLSRNPTNGTRSILLRATGDDHEWGRTNVVAGQYELNATIKPMNVWPPFRVVVPMTTTIARADLQLLPEGPHPIAVSSQDAFGNWGVPSIISVNLDLTGPTVMSAIVTPDYLDLSGPPPVTSVRLTGRISDTLSSGLLSTLAGAEAFIDTPGPDGTGMALFPSDGLFDETGEAVYFDIPIGVFTQLAQGPHSVLVHGLDAAGNWGAFGSATVTIYRAAIDSQGPLVGALSLAPNPTNGAALVTLTALASDPGALSNVTAAEWWIGNGPHQAIQAADGTFDSTVENLTAQINVTNWARRTYIINVRARDAAMNWGPTVTVSLRVSAPGAGAALILADGFEAGNLNLWTEAIGPVSVTPAAAIAPDGGTLGMQAVLGGAGEAVEPAYVAHIMPQGEPNYRASFYFSPNSTEMLTASHDIFVGLTGVTLAPIWGIEVEASGNPDGGYEVMAWALSGGVRIETQWYDIGDAPHQLGIAWKSGPSTEFSLAIDGTVVETLAEMNTGAYLLHGVRLGPSGELDAGLAGVEYFDAFRATRALQMFLPAVIRGQ